MPELPEVETVRRGLEKTIVGHTVTGTHVLLDKAVQPLTPEQFADTVIRRTIERIGRRGKYLLLFLSRGLCLVAHLRMTGRFAYVPSTDPLHPHTRIVLHLDQDMDLRFVDMRTFGGIQAIPADGWDHTPGLAKLGPEPLSEDLTPQWLHNRARRRTLSVKGFLLDQRTAAGIGNIYADESLHRAGIHPKRPAGSLTAAEWEALCRAVRTTMEEGIAHRGTSVQSYQNLDGRPGSYQDRLQVYGRAQKPCLRCSSPIEKIRVAGRGTHFCPQCQPMTPSSGKRRRNAR